MPIPIQTSRGNTEPLEPRVWKKIEKEKLNIRHSNLDYLTLLPLTLTMVTFPNHLTQHSRVSPSSPLYSFDSKKRIVDSPNKPLEKTEGGERKMSCNGCRVLRKGCNSSCILRPCLDWIPSPEAQGNATLFVSKFFGRSDLISFIAAVPPPKRPALFQSLLFEACGRTINPVNGAVGLLSTGNWHVCQAAVETVLAGGTLQPITAVFQPPQFDERSEELRSGGWSVQNKCRKQTDMSPPIGGEIYSEQSMDGWMYPMQSLCSEVSGVSMQTRGEQPKLLNLLG